jgi:hypothetical protein
MSDAKTQAYLAIFDALPDLLALARQQDPQGVTVYAIQDALREEHRSRGLPFKWSMPFRHLYTCFLCGEQGTEVLHEIEIPSGGSIPGRKAELYESMLHAARAHGKPLPEDCCALLDVISRTVR